jgi:hypothetical protein
MKGTKPNIGVVLAVVFVMSLFREAEIADVVCNLAAAAIAV